MVADCFRARIGYTRSGCRSSGYWLRIAFGLGSVTLIVALEPTEDGLRIAFGLGSVTLAALASPCGKLLRIAFGLGSVTLDHKASGVFPCCGLLSGSDRLHSKCLPLSRNQCCGLLSGSDRLHSSGRGSPRTTVADCFRARIGYTRPLRNSEPVRCCDLTGSKKM